MCNFKIISVSDLKSFSAILIISDFNFEGGSGGPAVHLEGSHEWCLEAGGLVLAGEDMSYFFRQRR